MGKKGRKTRWRTLAIPDHEYSDSEESNTTTSGRRAPKVFPQKSYYSRFTYSSQSTPTRRYQYDGTKSTRSSSTASENKITFNEDEYTRITTPRQDVLFKKGYLSKPKTYQTQTSTGNSTTSTGNSTGNGTPDHQSTDLEYESQFVFPNGFVDQNGIYYINSFEPYPLMVYNPPTYYPDYSSVKSKRCSTGSVTESTSPSNEEAGQDLSQSETPSNVSDFTHVYNVIYPAGFYFNGACQPEEATAVECAPKRLKKKRRKRLSRSKSVQDGTTSEYTNESSEDEVSSDPQESTTSQAEIRLNEEQSTSETEQTKDNAQPSLQNGVEENEESTPTPTLIEDTEENEAIENRESVDETENIQTEEVETKTSEDASSTLKYDLKPDAEEFVPRAYRGQEIIPMEPNIHFIKIPSNFVPLPIINPVGDFNGQSFNAFIPPGIPINFIPQNFVNFIPNVPPKIVNEHTEATPEAKILETNAVEVPKSQIDIAKIVSKLEEAAKDQDDEVLPKEDGEGHKNTTKTPDKRNNFNRRNFRRARNVSKNNETTNNIQKTTEKQSWKRSNDKESVQLSPKPAIRNYSDTLKKPQPVLISEEPLRNLNQQQLCKTAQKKVKDYKEIRAHTLQQTSSRSASEWVSVTNRKKRKNKNVEELEEIEVESIEESLQEVDVPQICDVIETIEILPESEPEVPISSLVEVPIATIENPAVEASIETEIESSVVESKITPEPQIAEEKTIAETAPLSVLLLPKDTKLDKPKNSTKKKSKKSIKLPIKRVIITDIDLSLNVTPEEKTQKVVITEIELSSRNLPEEKAQEVVKLEEPIEEPLPAQNAEEMLIEVDKPEDVVDSNIGCELNERPKESQEKRVKKKKKKTLKQNVLSELNLNVADDSYDFLLETSILDESADRTNIEMSQELDKMIQRGMYTNLEEKIKSLNISTNDSFFKTIINNISSREPSVEKNGFNQTPDFSKILNNTSYLLKSHPGVVNTENAKASNFLDKPPSQKLMREDKVKEDEIGNEAENLYPITKAVKEWMTKTRETTPDVEILKSPSTIYREFGMDERKNGDKVLLSSELRNEDVEIDDEITIYSLHNEDNVDLLECWEDEISPEVSKKNSSVSLVEEGEDVLEIYDSKYGKNEDFLKIQKEIGEKKLAGNFPKHGNLPYRAICCSIM